MFLMIYSAGVSSCYQCGSVYKRENKSYIAYRQLPVTGVAAQKIKKQFPHQKKLISIYQ
jgi:hypothetical protein